MAKQAQLKLDFSNAFYERDISEPIFLACQGIKGSLHVRCDSRKQLDMIELVVTGKNNTKTTENDLADQGG
jgi:hypothetical protein